MKRIIISLGLISILLSTSFVAGGALILPFEQRSFHRGTFQAELGIRDNNTPVIELDGSFRDFRGRHVLTGDISPSGSEKSARFQGLLTRNFFMIQTAYRNHIVNVIGRIYSYDEDQDEFQGVWKGFILGHGRTSGWIVFDIDS